MTHPIPLARKAHMKERDDICKRIKGAGEKKMRLNTGNDIPF